MEILRWRFLLHVKSEQVTIVCFTPMRECMPVLVNIALLFTVNILFLFVMRFMFYVSSFI